MDMHEICLRFELGYTVECNSTQLFDNMKNNRIKFVSDKILSIFCVLRSAFKLNFVVDEESVLAYCGIDEKKFHIFLKKLQQNGFEAQISTRKNLIIVILNRLGLETYKIRELIIEEAFLNFAKFDHHLKNIAVCTYIHVLFNPQCKKNLVDIVKKVQLFTHVNTRSITACYCKMYTVV